MTNALIQQSADLANRPDSMLVTTIPTVPGYRITEVKGIVRGNTVRARNVGRDIIAVFKSLVGGEIAEYTKLMAESREQALDRMRAEAYRAMGQDWAAEADLNAVASITRARLNEAEQSLGRGGGGQPAVSAPVTVSAAASPARTPNRFAKPKSSPLQSPIILATGAITIVGVLGTVVVMILF